MKYRVPHTSYFEWQSTIIEFRQNPPLLPINGDRFIISNDSTDPVWQNYIDHIASYVDNIWEYTTPKEGMILRCNTEKTHYLYRNSQWIKHDLSEDVFEEIVDTTLTYTDLNRFHTNDQALNISYYLPPIIDTIIGRWVGFIKLNYNEVLIYPDTNDQIASKKVGARFKASIIDINAQSTKLLACSLGRWVEIGGDDSWK